MIQQGDSAANLVELYILRVQAAELRYQSNARIFELKNEANALACEIWRLREQAGEFEVLSQVLFEEQDPLWQVVVNQKAHTIIMVDTIIITNAYITISDIT